MMKGLIIQQPQHVVEDNISNLTSASGDASVSSDNRGMYPQKYLSPPSQTQSQPVKKKRNLPGNPDPDAEVIALSPKSLMATNRFVCDICNKGFQRDQNLQLHRRGHNLPWKLKQRTSKEVRKKVYVCPETSCVHHDPSKALGDLTGIKKHFCRKHGEKKWKCDKCSKCYAVRSDLKAHSKTCGTREYRCDCGTLFSRRDSYISHRALCDALAEESAKAISGNANPFFSSQAGAGSSSTSHMNLQVQSQFDSNDMQAFSLKKEPQTFDLRPEVPQWLAFQPVLRAGPGTPPIDLSSSIFSTRFDQDFRENQELAAGHESRNPNPSLGPSLPPYHPTATPHISATALLQKAAQMGATMSSKTSSASAAVPAMMQGPHQAHVSADSSNHNTASFGLNLSSREELASGFVYNFGNKAAGDAGTAACTSGPSTLLQDMMTSLSSSGFEGSTFEDAFGGFLNPKRDETNLHEPLSRTTSHQFSMADEAGSGGSDGMTRDFLGLRPLSHSDIFNIAGLGNCMNASSNEHQNQNQKPWQD